MLCDVGATDGLPNDMQGVRAEVKQLYRRDAQNVDNIVTPRADLEIRLPDLAQWKVPRQLVA